VTEIRIELGAEVNGPGPKAGKRHGIFEYSCVRYPRVRGYSRQPLLDACRKLKALYGLTGERVGLFRKGRSESDLSCQLEVGVATTVSEPDRGVIHFTGYRTFYLDLPKPEGSDLRLVDLVGLDIGENSPLANPI
jgi:hypothetical protein